MVAFDDADTDVCLGTWTPPQTGTFIIRVVNRGRLANKYRIQTN